MQPQIMRLILEQFKEAYTRLYETLTVIMQIPNISDCCNLRAGNGGADQAMEQLCKAYCKYFQLPSGSCL